MHVSVWLTFAALALVAYGLWGFFPKLALGYLSPLSVAVFGGIGSALVTAVVAVVTLTGAGSQLNWSTRGIVFALLGGLAGGLGSLAFVYALRKGGVLVVPLTSLYPVITVALGVALLGEAVTLRQWLALGLMMGGVVLFLM